MIPLGVVLQPIAKTNADKAMNVAFTPPTISTGRLASMVEGEVDFSVELVSQRTCSRA